jgi:hypothetical protein
VIFCGQRTRVRPTWRRVGPWIPVTQSTRGVTTNLNPTIEFCRWLIRRLRTTRQISTHGRPMVTVSHCRDQDPPNEAQRVEAIHRAAEQRSLTHITSEGHPHPTGVLQPTGPKGGPSRRLVREPKWRISPQSTCRYLRGNAFEANWHVGHGPAHSPRTAARHNASHPP